MQEISRQIWDMKYRFKAGDGTPVDRDVADSWARVATCLAMAEAPEKRMDAAASFARALTDHKFLPAGRILAGAGTGRSVTLFNCFVMGDNSRFHGRDFLRLARSRTHPAARRWHRLRFLDLASAGRIGGGRGRGCVGARLFHGSVGRDVPHHHERGLQARRDDGDLGLRSSRYRDLYRSQARLRPAVQFQPFRPGQRRLHGGGGR